MCISVRPQWASYISSIIKLWKGILRALLMINENINFCFKIITLVTIFMWCMCHLFMTVQQIMKPNVVNSTFRSLQIHRPNSDETKSPLSGRTPCYFLYIWLLLELVSPTDWLQLEVHLGDRQSKLITEKLESQIITFIKVRQWKIRQQKDKTGWPCYWS